jgi:hypothetical protein
MTLDLSDEEKLALAGLLKRSIEDDRYPLSPRIGTLKAILAKIEPLPLSRFPHQNRMIGRAPPLTLASGGGRGEVRARRADGVATGRSTCGERNRTPGSCIA